MTTSSLMPPAPSDSAMSGSSRKPSDHRGSWIPSWAMVTSRFMELRKRRGLMIALVLVNIGIPVVFLAIRLIAHAVAPHSYGPAGGYDIFSAMVAVVLFIFGFIVAATVGCTAGSVDLTDGMFRHLVVTGRSRVALYFARIPAGLAIIVPMVAAGFAIVCLVCVFAAPAQLNYDGVNVPQGLSRVAFESWSADHADQVICNFNFDGGPNTPNVVMEVFNYVPCGNGPGPGSAKQAPGSQVQPQPSRAQIESVARLVALQNFASYSGRFISPSISLMIRSGLWIELYAAVGFLIGLGLSSLMGQRTVPVVLLIVLEIVLTPLLRRPIIPHMINLQRGLIGIAAGHLEPAGLPSAFGGNQGGAGSGLLPESITAAICVIVGWVVVWTAIGTWRMATRDA